MAGRLPPPQNPLAPCPLAPRPDNPAPASPDAKGGRLRAVLGILIASGLLAYALAQVPLEDRLQAGPNQDGVILELRLGLEGAGGGLTSPAGSRPSTRSPPNPRPGGASRSGTASGSASRRGGWTRCPGYGRRDPHPLARTTPGLPSLLRTADPRAFPASLATLALATLLIATRWWRLLRALGCGTTWRNGMRITWTASSSAWPSQGSPAGTWLVPGSPSRQPREARGGPRLRCGGSCLRPLGDDPGGPAPWSARTRCEALQVPVALAAGVSAPAGAPSDPSAAASPGRLARLPLGNAWSRLEGAGGRLAQSSAGGPRAGPVEPQPPRLRPVHLAGGDRARFGPRLPGVLVVSTVASTLSASHGTGGLGVGGSCSAACSGGRRLWAIGVATSLMAPRPRGPRPARRRGSAPARGTPAASRVPQRSGPGRRLRRLTPAG